MRGEERQKCVDDFGGSGAKIGFLLDLTDFYIAYKGERE